MIATIRRLLHSPLISYKPDLSKNMLRHPFDYLDVLIAFRWWIIGAMGVVGCILLAIIIQSKLFPPEKAIIPPLYTSQARIIMSANPRSDVISENNMNYIGVNIVGVDTITLAQEVLFSPMVIDPIIEQFNYVSQYNIQTNIRDIGRKIFRSRLRVVADIRTRRDPLVTISFSDSNPETAKRITDALVDHLQQALLGIEQLRYQNNILSIQDQLQEVSKKMTGIEQRMLQLQKQIDGNMVNRSPSESLSGYLSENETLKRNHKTLEELYATLSGRYELSKIKAISPGITPFYIIAYPELPEGKSMVGFKRILLVVMAGTLIAGILFAIAFHVIVNIYMPMLIRSWNERSGSKV